MYCQVANRLSELIDDVGAVRIDRDEKREILTLEVEGKDGTSYPARSLSDGTLRFLALTVMELDPAAQGGRVQRAYLPDPYRLAKALLRMMPYFASCDYLSCYCQAR
jgi:hypothetical protein